jgi:hypothetical protein
LKIPEDFIRVSALPGYPDCPRRVATTLFGREIVAAGYTLRTLEPSIGAPIGTAVHAGAALIMKEKAISGVTLPAKTAIECAMETLREKLAEGAVMDRETPTSRDAEFQVQRMTHVYRDSVAPDIQPIIVEELLEAEVEPGLILTGHSDVIAREPGRVRDLKCGKKLPNCRAQLGGYSLLAKSQADPVDVQVAGIDFIQRTSAKKPQPMPVMTKDNVALSESAAMNVIRTIAADLRVFREGDASRHLLPGDAWAFLANPSSMLCSPKYCRAAHTDWCQECMKASDDAVE